MLGTDSLVALGDTQEPVGVEASGAAMGGRGHGMRRKTLVLHFSNFVLCPFIMN